MFSKVKRGVEIDTGRILRTPEGKIDTSANPRDAKKYTPEFLERKAFDFRKVRQEHPEVGFGSGIYKDIVVREIPAPDWQKTDGKNGDKVYQIAQGYLRAHVAELDGIKNVPATVYSDLDDEHFAQILNDHGGETDLEEAELYEQMEKLVILGWTDAQIFQHVRGTMEKLFRLSTKAKEKLATLTTDEEKAKFLMSNTWKWHFQKARRLANVPFKFRNEMYKFIRKEQAWPKEDDLQKASSLHDEDKKNLDGTRNESVTRSKPGPKFEAFWNDLMAMLEHSKSVGEKPRSVSMMRRDEVDKLFDLSEDSLIARVILQRMLNKPGFTNEIYAEVIKWLAGVERDLGEAKMAELVKLMPVKPKEPTGK